MMNENHSFSVSLPKETVFELSLEEPYRDERTAP